MTLDEIPSCINRLPHQPLGLTKASYRIIIQLRRMSFFERPYHYRFPTHRSNILNFQLPYTSFGRRAMSLGSCGRDPPASTHGHYNVYGIEISVIDSPPRMR
ncbi:hypothetical protein FPOAC2_11259 [Fusarium poae]